MSVFDLPKDGHLFIRDIFDRCSNLIASGIWSGVSPAQFRRWTNNYKTDNERYFAARLLDVLIYRSKNQTIAMMEQLFQRTIPDALAHDSRVDHRRDGWLVDLRSHRTDPGLRIVPIAGPELGPPTKSGSTVARMYTHEVGVNAKWVIWPSQMTDAYARGIRAFVFVDDFLGTGTQFGTFERRQRLARFAEDCSMTFAPLANHVVGRERLEKELPWLHVCSVESLDRSYSLFSASSRAFDDGVNTCSSARSFYFDLLRSRELRPRTTYAAGFGRLALAYVFEHATPNNCLPLLWYPGERWEPLFRR